MSALVALSMTSLLVELLVALGIIARPLPSMGGQWSTEWTAALVGIVVYCALALAQRPSHRLNGVDAGVAAIYLLLAHCAVGFAQLTTVLMPRTVLQPAAQAATAAASVASDGVASLRAVALCISAVMIAFWLATRDQPGSGVDRGLGIPAIVTSTFIAALLCLFIPVAWVPTCSKGLAHVSQSAAAAATAPARLGAVSFPLLWATLLVIDAFRTPASIGVIGRLRFAVFVAFPLVLALTIKAEPKPSLSIPLALGLAVLAHLFEVGAGRLKRLARSGEALRTSTLFSSSDVGLICVFFMSGMAALVYQVVFAKGLALIFGSTSHASTIVLATYMSGLALGSWLGGKFAERVTRPILVYAGAELGIALVCVFAPITLKATRAVYVMIASGADPAESWLVGLQLGLGALVLIPPTLLMGVTLPMLTRHLIARRDSLGVSAGVLYSSNTLGAAAGAVSTGYLLMPALGVTQSLRVAVALNIVVAGIALLLGRRARASLAASETGSGDAGSRESTIAADSGTAPSDVQRVLGWIALAQLSVGGFVTFGLETTFVHLLATIAGNSAYAFSLMLFAFLVGLGVGSNVARRWLHARRDFASALLFCQAMLALTLLLGVPFWDAIPTYFALFGPWAPANSFAARELIRFLACLVVMLPPALFIGAQFPIAMDVIGRAWAKRRIAALGFASALNTLGNILGALVVGFMLLPRVGSLGTLHLLIVACLFLAALSIPYTASRLKPIVVGLLVVEAGLYLRQPAQFNLTALASGSNVYFQWQQYGRVIDSAESLDGGLTTVAVSGENRAWTVLTLLTNGKFQGDDSAGGEMKAQSSLALAPLLHTQQRNRALVIGFGTGTTTKVFHQARFERIDVAELSGDILTLADRHFKAVNEGVLHEPEVRTHVTDGRNFLLLDQAHYDVISIELSSIWFAGAANLYNREFYQLVRARLAPSGVLQQWVQLHRLAESDIATILSTLSEQFPNIWLYFLGKQGILVACVENCQPSQQTVSALDQSVELASTLRLFDGHAGQVLKGRLLTPRKLRVLVQDAQREFGPKLGTLIATDDNVTLEYTTPKGNVRRYDDSLDQNLRYLDKYKESDPFAATALAAHDAPYLAD